MKHIITVLLIGWLLRHVLILPCVDWEEHEVTGVEFKIIL